jgi:hypothetical protein
MLSCHVEVSQHVGRDFGAGMTQIAWRVRLVGSGRCADRTPQRGVPTIVLTRVGLRDLQTMSLAAKRNISDFLPWPGRKHEPEILRSAQNGIAVSDAKSLLNR